MIIGERHRPYPSVYVPPWSVCDDPLDDVYSHSPLSGVSFNSNGSFRLQEALTGLQRYLPSNNPDLDSDSEMSGLDTDSPVDAFSCDQFRIYDFKVRRCARAMSHDWTDCPFAHPGEKARRRDPRKCHYSGTACPEFRKGSCVKGDACEFAHGVFECWLHPARYRTQPCKDGIGCRRRVCFFAHTAEQLRVLPQPGFRDSYDGSPLRQAIDPPGLSPPSESPPKSPTAYSFNRSHGSASINEIVASLRNLQLAKAKSLPSHAVQASGSCFVSPRGSMLRPGFSSLPATPTDTYRGFWDRMSEEEPVMERVESGKSLRAKMFEKLSKENPLERADPDQASGAPDVGWVSDLVNDK